MSNNNTIDNCSTCTSAWKNFRHLSKQELQFVNENRFEASFKPGEIIMKQGSPASNALFLSQGMAKVYIEGAKGRDFILSIARPGRMIMGPGAYTTSRHSYTVSAITKVHACFISFDVFRKLVKSNGEFAESMLEDISAKSMRTHQKMVNLSHRKMPGRLAEALIYFADEIFMSDEFEVLLSRQEIGEMTNMAKESVVRILKEFSDSGIIEYDSSRIKIIDKQKLNLILKRG
ncbi:MAG: Crp/Fnr family transcriptional regulator [Bacteroidia bacterium]|nr:Crp/Fnr family transcriptional regulator [Bacteroidia bacterium]